MKYEHHSTVISYLLKDYIFKERRYFVVDAHFYKKSCTFGIVKAKNAE